MIRKISGKPQPNTLKHLTKNQTEATARKDIAEVLAEAFSENSSPKNSNQQFISYKSKSEKQRLNFKTNNSEKYNLPFTLAELKEAIQPTDNIAVVPDEIHYEFLKHFTKNSLNYLQKIFNDIGINGTFPESWKTATIILISKPGKDNSNPANYHPIPLTSCLCKTMQPMENKRLVWYLESNKRISNTQCGFWKRRSTMDHVIKLETSIREANIQKQHLVAVFFDLEKADETTWKFGTMKDLHSLGLWGRLPNIIKSLLSDRQFRVRIGLTFFNLYKQKEGVPQGSIQSVTLFNIKINSIIRCLTLGIDGYLYVDDSCITSRSKYMRIAVRQLQQCINKITHWANTNGFKRSKSKTSIFVNWESCRMTHT